MAKKVTMAKKMMEGATKAPANMESAVGEGATKAPAKVFSIPNGAVGTLLVLLNIPLHGEQSRARNRLAKIFDARRQWCLDEHIKIQQKYAEKEKDGSCVKPPEGSPDPYVVSPENMKKGEQDLIELMEAPFALELDKDNKRDLVTMRPKILESTVPMDTMHGMDYDLICKAFEAI